MYYVAAGGVVGDCTFSSESNTAPTLSRHARSLLPKSAQLLAEKARGLVRLFTHYIHEV
jgi:hypothetical protein